MCNIVPLKKDMKQVGVVEISYATQHDPKKLSQPRANQQANLSCSLVLDLNLNKSEIS